MICLTTQNPLFLKELLQFYSGFPLAILNVLASTNICVITTAEVAMQPEKEFRLRCLCEETSHEHNSSRLLLLVKQINQLLDEKRLEIRVNQPYPIVRAENKG